jgi:hypothetical protein
MQAAASRQCLQELRTARAAHRHKQKAHLCCKLTALPPQTLESIRALVTFSVFDSSKDCSSQGFENVN